MGLGLFKERNNGAGQLFFVRGRRYRVIDTIGQGTEATVYRCEDQYAAQYAVKVFYFSRFAPVDLPEHVQKFNKEGRIMKSLNARSHHFIHVYDFEYNPYENVGYIIMELGQGSLRDQLVGVPLSSGLQKSYWRQIVTMLKNLQDSQVVHADIKPDNMIFVNGRLKLTDFGLAFTVLSPDQMAPRPGVRGSLDYMAPEVFHHQTGCKSDVWAAGIILYEMTYGRSPFFNIADPRAKADIISSMAPIPFQPIRNRSLFDCMRKCLQVNHSVRLSAYGLLAHPYTRSS